MAMLYQIWSKYLPEPRRPKRRIDRSGEEDHSEPLPPVGRALVLHSFWRAHWVGLLLCIFATIVALIVQELMGPGMSLSKITTDWQLVFRPERVITIYTIARWILSAPAMAWSIMLAIFPIMPLLVPIKWWRDHRRVMRALDMSVPVEPQPDELAWQELEADAPLPARGVRQRVRSLLTLKRALQLIGAIYVLSIILFCIDGSNWYHP